MVTSLFNLGGSGGGISEERVLELIASSGAPMVVEYTDLSTNLALLEKVYANPEKYVVAYRTNAFTVFLTVNNYQVDDTKKQFIGTRYYDDKLREYYFFIFATAPRISAVSSIDISAGTELVNFSDIDEELGLKIYANPEKYVIKRERYIFLFNQALTYSGQSIKAYANVSYAFESNTDVNVYERFCYVNADGEAFVLDNDRKLLGLEIVKYDDINTAKGLEIYAHPEKYIICNNVNDEYAYYTRRLTNKVYFSSIFEQDVINNNQVIMVTYSISEQGWKFRYTKDIYTKSKIDNLLQDYATKEYVDDKLGDIEALLSEI